MLSSALYNPDPALAHFMQQQYQNGGWKPALPETTLVGPPQSSRRRKHKPSPLSQASHIERTKNSSDNSSKLPSARSLLSHQDSFESAKDIMPATSPKVTLTDARVRHLFGPSAIWGGPSDNYSFEAELEQLKTLSVEQVLRHIRGDESMLALPTSPVASPPEAVINAWKKNLPQPVKESKAWPPLPPGPPPPHTMCNKLVPRAY